MTQTRPDAIAAIDAVLDDTAPAGSLADQLLAAERERDQLRQALADVWTAINNAGPTTRLTTTAAEEVRELAADRDTAWREYRAARAELDTNDQAWRAERDDLTARLDAERIASAQWAARAAAAEHDQLRRNSTLIARLRDLDEQRDRAYADHDTVGAPLIGPVDQDAVDVLARALAAPACVDLSVPAALAEQAEG